MITVCTPTLNRQDLLPQLLISLGNSSLKPDKFVVLDNSGTIKASEFLSPLCGNNYHKDIKVEVHISERNLGVGNSWNWFLKNYDDFVIIVNDDIKFHYNSLKALVHTAQNNADWLLLNGSGHSGNAFSCFLLKKEGFELFGEFDSMLWPAYYEDNDYVRRMKLLGHWHHEVVDATFDHVGSATIGKFTEEQMHQHHRQFSRNTEYYVSKWGGIPGQETFTVPFNGIDKSYVIRYMQKKYGY